MKTLRFAAYTLAALLLLVFASDDKYTWKDEEHGYIKAGESLKVASMTIAAAKEECKKLSGCRGFTFDRFARASAVPAIVDGISFRNSDKVIDILDITIEYDGKYAIADELRKQIEKQWQIHGMKRALAKAKGTDVIKTALAEELLTVDQFEKLKGEELKKRFPIKINTDNETIWRTAYRLMVSCTDDAFDHCPQSGNARCCNRGLCGMYDQCEALAETIACTDATVGRCPTLDGVACCGKAGRCTLDSKCVKGGVDRSTIMYILVCAFIFCGFAVCFGVWGRRQARERDLLMEGATVTYHGEERGQIGTLGTKNDYGRWQVFLRNGKSVWARKEELMVVTSAEMSEMS